MLNPPDSFSEDALRALLANTWGLRVSELEYMPVGFGTHHWSVRDTDGTRWFVNVDEIHTEAGASATRLRELSNALAVPRALRDQGRTFAIAPVPTTGTGGTTEPAEPAEPADTADTADSPDSPGTVGTPILAELPPHFAVSVYAHLDGDSFDWQPWEAADPDVRTEALAIVAELHATPRSAWGPADTEDFAIPQRGVLHDALAGRLPDPAAGPFAGPVGDLVRRHTSMLGRLLDRHDALAEAAAARPETFVLTHGEPHAGNFMRVRGRLVLIDWDTALIAPPERDLWSFGLGDPAGQELYRLRWDLTETAVYLAQAGRPHRDSANDRAAWSNLVDTLAGLETTAARI